MQRVGLIGLSYRTATLKELARFTLAPEELSSRLLALREHCQLQEVAYLSTCNRVEIAFATETPLPEPELLRRVVQFFVPEASAGELETIGRTLYQHRGTAAANHLFRVASSLDSMVIGETEILRQVKRTYQTGTELGTVGPVLHQLFSFALKAAKRVHTETQLTSRPVSMVSLATGLIRDHLAGAAPGARVVLVGAGEMTVKAATYLLSQGPVSLVFVNRTLARAEELAARFNGEAQSLETFLANPGRAEVILSATSAPGPLFNPVNLAPMLEGRSSGRPVLLIDMAIPRDFDAALDRHPAVRLHDIEALRVVAEENQLARAGEIERALPIIEHQIRVLRRKLIEARMSPAVVKLQQETVNVAGQEIERLLLRELSHLSEQDKTRIRQWGSRLGQRIAQLPISSLKEMAVACECGSAVSFTQKSHLEGWPLVCDHPAHVPANGVRELEPERIVIHA